MEMEAEYFSRRAQQEREAGMKAANSLAREAHLELARRYDGLATSIKAGGQHLGFEHVDKKTIESQPD